MSSNTDELNRLANLKSDTTSKKSGVEGLVIKLVVCQGIEDYWACKECPHSVPHTRTYQKEYGGCTKWGYCDATEKNVRCTKVL